LRTFISHKFFFLMCRPKTLAVLGLRAFIEVCVSQHSTDMAVKTQLNIGYNVDREVHGRLHCTCGLTGFLSVHCHLSGLLAGFIETGQP